MLGVAEKSAIEIEREGVIAEAISKANNVKNLVELFCQKEYEGIWGLNAFFRASIIKYTPKEYQKLRKLKDFYPYEWCLLDPLHIVESYKILELDLLIQLFSTHQLL